MRSSSLRCRGTGVLIAAACAVGLASVAPGAVAASDACPNAAIREQQHSTHLPDCRAYELVTPPDKNNYDAHRDSGSLRASVSGDAVTYDAVGPFPNTGAVGTMIQPRYVARRTDAGWDSRSIDPPHHEHWLDVTGGVLGELADPAFFQADLAQNFMFAYRGTAPGSDPDQFTINSHDNVDHTYDALLTTGLAGLPTIEARAGTKVFFESSSKLTPDAPDPQGAYQVLYEYDTATRRTVTVGRLPGDAPSPATGNPLESVLGSSGGVGSREPQDGAVSEDGSRVVFSDTAFTGALSDQGNNEGYTTPNLYMRRDPSSANASTLRINQPETTIPTATSQPAAFRGASADGARVYFTTADQLVDAQAGDGSVNLFRWEPDKPVGHRLTLVSKDRTGNGASAVVGGVLGVSDDGGRLYFSALGALTGDAPTNVPDNWKLYLWDDGTLSYIATLGTRLGGAEHGPRIWQSGLVDKSGWANTDGENDSRVSQDGRYLLFRSTMDIAGHPATDPAAGTTYAQLYLYDAATAHVACVSCLLGGKPPVGWSRGTGGISPLVVHTRYKPRLLLAEGGHAQAVFETLNALDPRDVNGQPDVYRYDVESGRVALLSDGQARGGSYYLDASPDGRDVFIASSGRLTGSDRDDLTDIYDVRAGGGVAEPTAAASCDGDGCQRPAGSGPVLPLAASVAFDGAGNVVAVGPTPKPRISGRRLARGSVARIGVRVAGRGAITVSGAAVKPVTRRVARAGTYAVVVRLGAAASRRVRAGRRVTTTVHVRFAPRHGSPAQIAVRLTFDRSGKRR